MVENGLVVKETKNYQIMAVQDVDVAEYMEDRRGEQGCYWLINKDTGVVEFKTVMLPQALMAIDQYQQVLDDNLPEDEKERVTHSAWSEHDNVVGFFNKDEN